MFLFLVPILTSLLIGGSEGRAQDNAYNGPNQLNQPYYTPYGQSNQYGAQPFSMFQSFNPYDTHPIDPTFGQPNCGQPNPMEEELNSKINHDLGVPPIDMAQLPPEPEPAVPEAPCDKPGSEHMPLEVLCSLPPHKGTGDDDIFRYYYNPVVQQCIPFSYSGTGGNANRFVSVKNCYEICHPADPTVKKPRVVSGIKAYLVPNLKSDCKKSEQHQAFDRHKTRDQPKEVVIRQIPHPLDPTKTLTIIQNAQYIPNAQMNGSPGASGGFSNGFARSLSNSNSPNNQDIDPNVRRLYQYETQPEYIAPYGQPYGQPYGR